MPTHAVAAVAAPMAAPVLPFILALGGGAVAVATILSTLFCTLGNIKTKACRDYARKHGIDDFPPLTMLQKRGFAPGSSLPVPMSSDAAAAANPNETVSTFLTWLSQSTGGLSNSTGSTAIPENNNTLSLGPFGNFTIPVPAELARLLNATTTTSQENHFDFPEDFNTKLADWAVQKQNFTGEAPLVVAVQHPLNLSEQAVTLFNVWDEENPVGSQWLDTLTAAVEAEEPADGGEGDELKFPDGEDDKDLLQLVTDLFASMNGTIGTVQDVKNATLVAQRLGGVAATFEEVVEA